MATTGSLLLQIKATSENTWVTVNASDYGGLAEAFSVAEWQEANATLATALQTNRAVTRTEWSTSFQVKAYNRARADVAKILSLAASASKALDVRVSLDGTTAGQQYREGEAIITGFTDSNPVSEAPMIEVTLAGNGALTTGTYS